jgi:hypothetical protein
MLQQTEQTVLLGMLYAQQSGHKPQAQYGADQTEYRQYDITLEEKADKGQPHEQQAGSCDDLQPVLAAQTLP